jgi:putative ABC transport system substrate-binding protein
MTARAQQASTTASSIGLLSSHNIADWMIGGLRKGLHEAGYAEGRSLAIIYRAVDGQVDRLSAIAAELVNARVATILATGGPLPTRAAKAATTTIPIVFAYGAQWTKFPAGTPTSSPDATTPVSR